MAISKATLTVTTTENLKLNGVTYGNTLVKSMASCGEVTAEAKSVPTNGYLFQDLNTIQKQLDFVYLRVNNMDASNFIRIEFFGTTTKTSFKILPGESYETTCNEVWDYNTGISDKIARIAVYADTAECDVEMFYVSK